MGHFTADLMELITFSFKHPLGVTVCHAWHMVTNEHGSGF